MGQNCCKPPSVSVMTMQTGLCCLKQNVAHSKYSRHIEESEDSLHLVNVFGNTLELDPETDQEHGEEKINLWIDANAPNLGLPESDLGINRLKCVRYWEAVLALSKLNGSTVNFRFERQTPEDQATLVIEHKGKSLFVGSATKRASKREQARPLMEYSGPNETGE